MFPETLSSRVARLEEHYQDRKDTFEAASKLSPDGLGHLKLDVELLYVELLKGALDDIQNVLRTVAF